MVVPTVLATTARRSCMRSSAAVVAVVVAVIVSGASRCRILCDRGAGGIAKPNAGRGSLTHDATPETLGLTFHEPLADITVDAAGLLDIDKSVGETGESPEEERVRHR